MKTTAILFASILLVGCQTSGRDAPVPQQRSQIMSSADQKNKIGKHTENTQDHLLRRPKEPSSLARKNLWNFISSELNMDVPENPRVREQKRKILKNKRYLHDITLRAEPYMYWIVEQIKQRNMPMELILMPILESTFNPHATSPVDAAGLWQIMPGTGRRYGLKQNYWYDGRRDVAASTTAALNILQRLNRMFSGDWLLTIAAYNSGEGRVMQAIKANQAKGRPTHFWALTLPRETTLYVPKMLALSDIIKYNKKYSIKLPEPDGNRALAQIELNQQIHLTQVAEMAGISLKKLKSYNSGYTRNVTTPNGPHYIMLPKIHIEKFKDALKINMDSGSQYKIRITDIIPATVNSLNIKTGHALPWNNLYLSDTLRARQSLQLTNNINDSATYQHVNDGFDARISRVGAEDIKQ